MKRAGGQKWLVIAAALFLLICCGCGKGQPVTQGGRITPGVRATPAYAEGRELYRQVETQEEAEKTAELYGITLVHFGYGVAVFHTDENPEDVVARGKQNGWPPLSINPVHEFSDKSYK